MPSIAHATLHVSETLHVLEVSFLVDLNLLP